MLALCAGGLFMAVATGRLLGLVQAEREQALQQAGLLAAAERRSPPLEGSEGWDRVEQEGAGAVLSDFGTASPLIQAWGPDPQRRPGSAGVHAAALARSLGWNAAGMNDADPAALQALAAGLRPIREAYDLAPGTGVPGGFGGPGLPLSLRVGQIVAGAPAPSELMDPATLAATIRLGGPVPAETWSLAGHSGLAALELAAAGRREALPELWALAVEGPTAADRIAGLYAARQLAPLADWPPEHPATRRAQALVAQGRW